MSKPTRFEIGNTSNRPAPFTARLDKKTGCRVLCGRPGCNAELARLTIDGYETVAKFDALRPSERLAILTSLSQIPSLRFPPGWDVGDPEDPHNAVMGPTRHAARRYRADRGMASANPLTPGCRAREAGERLRSGRSFANRRGDPESRSAANRFGHTFADFRWVQATSVATLVPLTVGKVECPRCQGINRIDDSFIDAVRDRQHRLRRELLKDRDLDALIRQAQEEADRESETFWEIWGKKLKT